MDADQIKRFALDRKKSCKGKHDDKDDFDGTPQSPGPTEEAAEAPSREQNSKEVKGTSGKKGALPQAGCRYIAAQQTDTCFQECSPKRGCKRKCRRNVVALPYLR